MYFFHACNSVVVVEFNQTRYSVCEDAGFASITIVSDIPAPVNFSVQVLFTDRTATGECMCSVRVLYHLWEGCTGNGSINPVSPSLRQYK